MIFLAVAGPTPGSVSSCFSVAVFRSTAAAAALQNPRTLASTRANAVRTVDARTEASSRDVALGRRPTLPRRGRARAPDRAHTGAYGGPSHADDRETRGQGAGRRAGLRLRSGQSVGHGGSGLRRPRV